MSKYHTYTTKFTSENCLLESIRGLGLSPIVNMTPAALRGWANDRSEKARVCIQREQLKEKRGLYYSGDIGFRKNDAGNFEALINDMDGSDGEKLLGEIRQGYLMAEVTALWKREGRTAFETEWVKTEAGRKLVVRSAIPQGALQQNSGVGFSR